MFNDMVLISGVIVGLALGSFGYVLFRFAGRPAYSYRRLKKQIAALLLPIPPKDLGTAERDRLQRLAVELHNLKTESMPNWLTLAIQRRGENPDEAVRQLQRLVNCREPTASQRRRQAVCQALGLIADGAIKKS